MGVTTFNIASESNLPPRTSGRVSILLDYNELYPFTLADFTTLASFPYWDPDGDALESIIIYSLPSIGTLLLSSVPVTLNQVITSAQLVAGDLEYQADPAYVTGYSDLGTSYSASDVGTSTFAPFFGKVSIVVGQLINEPISVVGDGTMTIDYGEVGVFTRAMFTTGTTPPYVDPEGDLAILLKITGLPILGEIQLNGVSVSLNDIIAFTDIELGLLTYLPDLADTDGDMQGFTFQLADITGIFVG